MKYVQISFESRTLHENRQDRSLNIIEAGPNGFSNLGKMNEEFHFSTIEGLFHFLVAGIKDRAIGFFAHIVSSNQIRRTCAKE